jgi:hypothetical protein
VLTVAAVYGALQLEVDFSIEYFVDADSYIKNYLNANKEYFRTGSSFTIYTENTEVDYAAIQT